MPRSHPHPWHRGSIYGHGRRRPLDRDQRARYRFLLEAHYRAGRLPAKQHRVGTALLKRLGADGQCDPCYDTLGTDAGCSARTARRATATLRSLGLLSWQTRLIRIEWRAEQTSNQYELLTPAENPVPGCGGQNGRETRKKDNCSYGIEVPLAPPEVRHATLETLAAIATRRLKVLGLA